MAIAYAQFIAQFPEFTTTDQTTVERSLLQSDIEVNGYKGLQDETLRLHALMLRTAHNLTLDKWRIEGVSGPVKAIASNNDRIEYGSSAVGFDLTSTVYGVKLQALLRTSVIGARIA